MEIKYKIGDIVELKHFYVVEGSSLIRKDMLWIGEIASDPLVKSTSVSYKIKKDGETCFVYYDDFDIIRSI